MFNFKVSPEDVGRLEQGIRKQFEKVTSDPALLKDCGLMLTERIRFQARNTKPLNGNMRFPELLPATVTTRTNLAKYNPTNQAFSPSRSNVTLTGRFLDSLGFDITSPGEITLLFKGEHPGYKTEKGKVGKTITNQKLYEYLRDMTSKGVPKPYIAFSADGVNAFKPVRTRLNAIVKAYLRRALKLS